MSSKGFRDDDDYDDTSDDAEIGKISDEIELLRTPTSDGDPEAQFPVAATSQPKDNRSPVLTTWIAINIQTTIGIVSNLP